MESCWLSGFDGIGDCHIEATGEIEGNGVFGDFGAGGIGAFGAFWYCRCQSFSSRIYKTVCSSDGLTNINPSYITSCNPHHAKTYCLMKSANFRDRLAWLLEAVQAVVLLGY